MSENDVQILGAGQVGPGDYRKVNINGSGNITGIINAETVTVNGVATASELLTAQKLEVNGTFSGNHLKGGRMIIRGAADLKGTVECEHFELNGGIKCETINAERIEIRHMGHGEVKELVGSQINIKGTIPALTILNIEIKPLVFSARLIEADEVYLESTDADVVCGNIVHIGRGCRIGRVEYRDSLKVADGSSVGQIVKD